MWTSILDEYLKCYISITINLKDSKFGEYISDNDTRTLLCMTMSDPGQKLGQRDPEIRSKIKNLDLLESVERFWPNFTSWFKT